MNVKHVQFINEYLRCWNQTEAYRRVYPNSSDDAARANAARLIANDSVAAEIQRRIDENTMSANEVLMRQAEIGRSDIGDFLEQNPDGEISISLNDLATGERKPTNLIRKVTQRKVVRTIKDMTETETTLALELYDAQAAQVQIGKYHKLWTDKTEVTGKDGESIKPLVQIYLPANGRD